MKRADKFFPGWKMTWGQHGAYFWYLGQVYKLPGILDTMSREEVRKTIHIRALGSAISAKQIDHLKMFDAFITECLALLQPDNVAAQLRIAEMPLIRLRHGILEKFSPDRIHGMLRSARFKKTCLDDFKTEEELEQFRNTLCARTLGEVEVPAGDPF